MTITLRNFNSALKSINSQPNLMATIAGYVIQQAHVHRNLDAASRAFAAPVFVDQRDGKLNSLGVQLKNYIVAHSRFLQIGNNKETNKPTFKLKEKHTGQEQHFLVDLAATRSSGNRVFQSEPIADIGVQLLCFKAFVEYSAKVDPVVVPMTIKQLTTRLETIGKALDDRGIKALPAELDTALMGIDTLQKQILAAVANSVADDIDLAAFEQTLNVKPSSKSKAAPKAASK